jgi:two-component system, LuxR family, sensor kinase FixL
MIEHSHFSRLITPPETPKAVVDTWTPIFPVYCIVVAVGYYCGARLGMALTFVSEPVSTLWPPNALLLSALLVTRRRQWWVLLICVLPAHLLAEIRTGVPQHMSVLWYVSNSTEATLGAALILHYIGRPPRLDRVWDVSVLIAIAGVVAPVVSSFLDAGFVALTGWRYSAYWQVWQTRTLSNSLAALTVIPLLMSLAPDAVERLRRMRRADWLETAVLLLGLCIAAAALFHEAHPLNDSPALAYAPLPFLIWAAIRRGIGFVALCNCVVVLAALVGVLHGRSPFTLDSPERSAESFQGFLIIASASLMLLAGALAELRGARAVAVARLDQLKLALEVANVGTWEWDLERRRISWTPIDAGPVDGAVSPITLSSRELIRRIHAEDRRVVVRAFRETSQRTCEAEFRILDCNGHTAWMATLGKQVSDEDGKSRRMIGVYRNVTRRKSREEQLTMQWAQIARLNRVSNVGALSGALAHDLMQPLTAILSNAEVARAQLSHAEGNSEAIDAALGDIIADDLRMIEMIRHLRSLFERREVRGQQLDVNRCVESVIALERSYLAARGVTVNVRLDSALPPVLFDPVQLQQVLINLITNACDAMENNVNGKGHMEILTSTANDTVELVVTDNGVGIKNTEQIFEPLFTTKQHGIGLGLAICRTIVTAHGGRLWATNNATRGASLHISLPAVAAIGPVEDDYVSAAPPAPAL